MSRILTVALCGLAWAVPAGAQQLDHSTAIGLGYSHLSLDGEGANAYSLEGESILRFGQIETGVDLGFNRLNEDGSRVDQTSVEIAPSYWFTPGFGIGVYGARDTLDFEGTDLTLNSYGVEAQLRAAAMSGTLFVGETDVDLLGLDATTKDVGLRVRADLTPQASVWGSMVRSDIEETDSDARTWGIGGSLMVNDGFSTFASYQSSEIDGTGGDVNVAAIGMSWTTFVGGQEVMLSGEYASASGSSMLGSSDGNRVSLGATILLGDAQQKRTPAHTVTHNTLRGERNGLSGLFGSFGF